MVLLMMCRSGCCVLQAFNRVGVPARAQEVMQRGAEHLSKMINKNFDRQSLQPEETLFVTSEDVAADHMAAEQARGSIVKAALSKGMKEMLARNASASTGASIWEGCWQKPV